MKAKVNDECRWESVTACAGIQFSKSTWSVVPVEREEEAEVNPFLMVQEPKEIDATKAAFELAKENAIDLGELDGTGKDGRILLSDVKEVLDD